MTELLTTFCRGREVQLLWQPELETIADRIAEGFVPIEMAEGTRTFVDFRRLDHHNDYSHLPSACVTALEFYGTLGADRPARLMVNHTDADSVLTGVTLLGLLPRDLLEKLNPEVGLLDTDPLSVDFEDLLYGNAIRLWKVGMMSAKKSGWSWLYGMQLCLDIFEHFTYYEGKTGGLEERERARRKKALQDYDEAVTGPSGRVLLVAPSTVKGYDVQFSRQDAFPSTSLEGWRHWCVVSHVQKVGNVMLSCPNKEVAERAFGSGGLKNVFPRLPEIEGKEWGGREAVGGSPRGVVVPSELLESVLAILEDSLLTKGVV